MASPAPAPVAAEPVPVAAAAAAEPAAEPAVDPPAKKKRVTNKATYLVHGEDNSVLARYRSTSHRNAALKAASKKHTVIRIRKAGDDFVRIFDGAIIEAPRTVVRGGREITYRTQSRVKFVRQEPFVPKEPAPKEPAPAPPAEEETAPVTAPVTA